jgi:hypothetical protein
LQAFDFDGEALSFVITQLPAHGRLYVSTGANQVLGAQITAVPHTIAGSSVQLSYVMDPAYNGPDQIRFHARDGVLDSYPVVVDTTPLAERMWIGGTPGSPNAWGTLGNWSPFGSPLFSEMIRVPAGLSAPILITEGAQAAS